MSGPDAPSKNAGPSSNDSAENPRAAANITATLSIQLMGVAVGVIAFVAAVDLYLVDKRSVGGGFYFATVAGFAAVMLGMLIGAKGVGQLTRNGYSGDWRRTNYALYFGLQALLSVLGLILFLCSWFVVNGSPKDDDAKRDLKTLSEQVQQRGVEVEQLKKQISSLEQTIATTKSQKATTDQSISELRAHIKTLNDRLNLSHPAQPTTNTTTRPASTTPAK